MILDDVDRYDYHGPASLEPSRLADHWLRKLANAMLADAVELVRFPSNAKQGPKPRDTRRAREWLVDLSTDEFGSLRWVCAVLNLYGCPIQPERVAQMAAEGRLVAPAGRRVGRVAFEIVNKSQRVTENRVRDYGSESRKRRARVCLKA